MIKEKEDRINLLGKIKYIAGIVIILLIGLLWINNPTTANAGVSSGGTGGGGYGDNVYSVNYYYNSSSDYIYLVGSCTNGNNTWGGKSHTYSPGDTTKFPSCNAALRDSGHSLSDAVADMHKAGKHTSTSYATIAAALRAQGWGEFSGAWKSDSSGKNYLTCVYITDLIQTYALHINWNNDGTITQCDTKTVWNDWYVLNEPCNRLFSGNKPSRPGYTFTGWYCGSVKLYDTDGYVVKNAWVSNGTELKQWSDSSGNYKWKGDTWISPGWEKNKVLTLKYDSKAVKSAKTDKANYSPGATAKSTVELNYGYHFVSYSGTTVDGKYNGYWKANGKNFPSDTWTMTCDRTININTAKNDYTITFKKGDHVNSFTSKDGDTSVKVPYLTKVYSKASANTGYHLTEYRGTSADDSSRTDTWTSCKGMSSQDNDWTATRNRTITVFAAANTYYVKYDKGSTNNGGSVDNTTHTYDADVTLASNGFTGRSYSLSFDGNRPTDDWGQATVGTVNNLQATKSGNLGFNCWYITNANNNNNTYASAATNLGAKNYRTDNKGTATATAQWNSTTLDSFKTPSLTGYKFNGYYTSTSGGDRTTSVQVDPSTSEYSNTLYAQWTPITYKVTYHGNQNWNTSQGDYTQEITYDKHTALTDNKFTRNDNTMYNGVLYKAGYEFIGWGTSPDQKEPTYSNGQTVFNLTATDGGVINLYAIWKKTVNLTFDFNGGQYDNSTSDTVLTYDMYNSEFNHTFDIARLYGKFKGGNTYQKVYDEKGLNNNLTYTKSNGTLQRFLGYSLNSRASIPASQFDVFKASRAADYTIIDNTTLYAIWEPVLEVKAKIASSANVTDVISSSTDIPITTSLGQFTIKGGINSSTLKDSTDTIDYVKNIKGMVTNECTVQYNISAKGRDNITFKMGTDSRVLDIYNNGDADSKWKDSLNEITVFDKTIKNFTSIKSSLVVPQYIGTVQSYNTSNPKYAKNTKIYAIRYELSQPSYYYGKYFDTDERVTINAILFLKPGADPNKRPEDNTNIETLDGVQTIMDR